MDFRNSSAARVAVHSIILAADGDAAIANHRAFAHRSLIAHEVHTPSHVDEDDWFKVLAKYNLVWSLLTAARDGDLFVFAEDCLAFVSPFNPSRLIGNEAVWIAPDEHRYDRANGSLLILRRTPQAFAWLSAVIDKLKELARESMHFSRWQGSELVGMNSTSGSAYFEGAVTNYFFPRAGKPFPDQGALSATFNPRVSLGCLDARTSRMVIEHFTHCLTNGGEPFAKPNAVDRPDPNQLSGRFSRVAVLLLTPEEGADGFDTALESAHRYCKAHGYALFVKTVPTLRGDGSYDMLLQAAEHKVLYEYLLCIRIDTLFNRVDFKVPELFGDASLIIGQSALSTPAEVGCLGLRIDERGEKLVEALEGLREVYLATEIVPIRDLLANQAIAAGAHILDMSSFAPTCALRSDRSLLVRYADLQQDVRDLVMAADCLLERRETNPPSPPLKTALSFLRGKWISLILTSLLAILTLIATLR